MVFWPAEKKRRISEQIKQQRLKLIRQQALAFSAAGIENIIVIIDRPIKGFDKALRDSVSFVMLSGNSSNPLSEMVLNTIRDLKEYCEKIFICRLGEKVFDTDTIMDMMKKREDVVILDSKNKERNLLLINQQIMNWYLVYNGKQSLFYMWKPLADIDAVQYTKTHEKEKPEILKVSYETVINWI